MIWRSPRRAKLLIPAGWLAAAILTALAPAAWAQAGGSTAIRVESNVVLIPVLVLDKGRAAALQGMDPYVFSAEMSKMDFSAWEGIGVSNLRAKDFEVQEDGADREIEGVRQVDEAAPPLLRDNVGQYRDYVGVGGGVWAVPVPNNLAAIAPPSLTGYIIAYAAPGSTGKSCHDVTVKVRRRNSLVYARDEYCNAQRFAADPLDGTKLGKKMEAQLASKKNGKIQLSATAFTSFENPVDAATDIVLEFPLKPLHINGRCHAEGTIGILGAIYTKAGDRVTSFSDFMARQSNSGFSEGPLMSLFPPWPGSFCILYQPTRYETSVRLPAGEYELRAIIRDGKKFGRAETAITVAEYDPKQLGISKIAFVKRYRNVPEGSPGTSTTLPGDYLPLLSKGTEIIPATNAQFPKGGWVDFYLEIYRPQETGLPDGTIHTRLRIVDAKTGHVAKLTDPLNAKDYATPGSPVIPIGGGIDIKNLPSGSYLLEAQATDSTGASTAWSSANFTIE
jgi:hypothetical protein